jgi:MYXO-CTERM domain-containing protein
MKRLATLAALLAAGLAQAAGLPGQGNWQATLQARDLQGHAVGLDSAQAMFFYDSVLDVTWLRQASVPQLQTWSQARDWAAQLSLGGYDDWRLPTTLDTGLPGCARVTYTGGDCGYNVPTQTGAGANASYSELAHLFQVTLGNAAAYTPQGQFRGWAGQGTSWGLANTGSFEGLQATTYWSGSGVAGNANYAWAYHFGLGYQSLAEKGVPSQAIALRDGDVLAAVPEPSTWAMAAAGLLALGRLQRRRRA